MKFFIIFALFLLVNLISSLPEEKYTTKYDNIDIDSILKSDRLLKNYVDCLLDRKPCTKDATELKKYLPDALNNNCSKCSDKQKTASRKIIKHLIKNKPNWWHELETKYDPQRTYRTKYGEELRKEGIILP